MGLLSKIFRKKETNKNEKLGVGKENDSAELTEEELDKVCGHIPPSDWCPPVKVKPIDISGKQSGIKTKQKQESLGR